MRRRDCWIGLRGALCDASPSKARSLSAVCAASRSCIRTAIGAYQTARTRDVRLPVRGCVTTGSGRDAFVARGQTAYPLRNGALPGKGVRTGHRISVRVEFRPGTTADFSSAPVHPGGSSGRRTTRFGSIIELRSIRMTPNLKGVRWSLPVLHWGGLQLRFFRDAC